MKRESGESPELSRNCKRWLTPIENWSLFGLKREGPMVGRKSGDLP